MPTVANIGVSVTARTNRFKRGMKDARHSIRGFSGSVTSATKRIAILSSGLTALAGGAGLAIVVRRSFETIDALAKTSDKLGIATDRLAGLQHAAQLSGVAVRTFDLGLQRMTRRVAEAAGGSGEAQAAIKELGLDARALAAMSPDKQFRAIADAMEKVGNQSDRVRLGFKLFDSEGVALINTLRGGSKALDQSQAEAYKLGLALTRIEARHIERANDALTRMRASFRGLASQIAVNLAPFVVEIANRLTSLGFTGDTAGKRIGAAFEYVTKAIARTADVLSLLKSAFYAVRSSAAAAMTGVVAALDGVVNAIEVIVNKTRSFAHGHRGPITRLLFPREQPRDIHISRSFDALADELAKESIAALSKASEAFDDFNKGVFSKRVDKFFNDLKASADISAGKALSRQQGAMTALAVNAIADKRSAFGRAIDLGKTAVGGIRASQIQKVMDPQLKQVISILQEQRNFMKHGAFSAALTG